MPVALRLFTLAKMLKKHGFSFTIDINNPRDTELIYQLESIAYTYDEFRNEFDDMKDSIEELA